MFGPTTSRMALHQMGGAHRDGGFHHDDLGRLILTQTDHGFTNVTSRIQDVLQIRTAIFTGWGPDTDKNDLSVPVGLLFVKSEVSFGFKFLSNNLADQVRR